MNFDDKGFNEKGVNETSSSMSKMMKRGGGRVKPKFFKLLGQIMNSHMEVSVDIKGSQF
jgi:hypothetical protein